MDHAKHYGLLIDRARKRRPLVRCYFERHHILPRCMGGGNEDANLVRLTPQEHYVAHLLLAKMHSDNVKLEYARRNMLKRAGRRFAGSENKRYAREMERIALAMRSDYGKRSRWINRPRKIRYGRTDIERMRVILAPKQFPA